MSMRGRAGARVARVLSGLVMLSDIIFFLVSNVISVRIDLFSYPISVLTSL